VFIGENTYFDRIALVGCDTSRIRQGLTRNFAKMIYDNIPALKTAEITGRKGDMQINPDGTPSVGVIKLPSASKRTMILLSGCLLARAWAALTATSLL
jgi:hypothetical protein